MFKRLSTLAIIGALTSCTTLSDSMLVGGAFGAATGGFVGNQASDHNPETTGIGVIIGAATGALFGYLAHRDGERKQAEAKAQQSLWQGKPSYPNVSAPEVRAIWIPAKIDGDSYIGPHFIYKIERPAAFKQE